MKKPAAFSLIEILVTVALLTVIILGLVAMFDQTRRAFTGSFTQVDVLEAGRSAADVLSREMEQMAPYGNSNTINFYVDSPQLDANYPNTPFALLTQPLANPADIRTNLIQQVFYLTRNNQQWMCVGYKIDNYSNAVGSLYRYTTNVSSWQDVSNSLVFFRGFYPTNLNPYNFSRLIDGVVDFRIHALDTNGVGYGYFVISNSIPLKYGTYAGPLIAYGMGPSNFNYTGLSASASVTARPYAPNTSANYPYGTADDFQYTFTSNSVPAYVELELGVLEDRTLARYNALTNGGFLTTQAAWGYLTNHAGKVHMFRQRIPIRNVNPAAYQ